jgi:hypothetical protein
MIKFSRRLLSRKIQAPKEEHPDFFQSLQQNFKHLTKQKFNPYRQETALKQLNHHLQREFNYELQSFEIDKRVANLVCDMGYLIQDTKDPSCNKLHRLVKRSDSHLVVVCYEIRSRLMDPPSPEDNPDLI